MHEKANNTTFIGDSQIAGDDSGSVEWLELYRRMVLIRAFEHRVDDLYKRAMMPGFTHLSVGQEATAVGVCADLRRTDLITSTHRGHGHCIAKGARVDRMFAELLGKSDGYCQGKGGSMHIADFSSGNLGANAIVGGSTPIATGPRLQQRNSVWTRSWFRSSAREPSDRVFSTNR